MARVLAVSGACAVGKTTIINALNECLGWDRLGIDRERAFGGDWPSLVRKVRFIERATKLMHYPELGRHRVLTVAVVCDEDERRRRLLARREHMRRQDCPSAACRCKRPAGHVNYIIDATTHLTDDQIGHLVDLISM